MIDQAPDGDTAIIVSFFLIFKAISESAGEV